MVLKHFLIFTLFVVNILKSETVIPRRKPNGHEPKSILPENYMKEIRPPTLKSKPVDIEFTMKVVDINSINVEDMDFRMDMFLKQTWTDARLRIPEEMFERGDDAFTVPAQLFEKLWQPDLYFLNSKVVEIATLTQKFSSVTLYRNKTLQYSARMHAIVACQMEFRHYPMDIQVCPVNIESFGYKIDKIILKWGEAGVSISPELKLLQYHIGKPLELAEQNIYTSEKGGNFSRLVVYFRFERQIGHHLIQTFAPSTLVVMLSWFSFSLGLDAVPARVALLITCMLTLVTMFTGLRSDIPPVAYVKALDLWMAFCMLLVFAALSEFVAVKVLDQHYQLYKKEQKIQNLERSLAPWCKCALKTNRRSSKVGKSRIFKLCWITQDGDEKVLWKEIDRFSRMIFPMLFFTFMAFFWPMLILAKSYQ